MRDAVVDEGARGEEEVLEGGDAGDGYGGEHCPEGGVHLAPYAGPEAEVVVVDPGEGGLEGFWEAVEEAEVGGGEGCAYAVVEAEEGCFGSLEAGEELGFPA